jgi:hypothetical protein
MTRDVNMIADVVMNVFKARIGTVMRDIFQVARNQIIHHYDLMAFGNKVICQMTADEPCAACN